MNDFFGTSEWKNANDLQNDEREKYLIDLYKRKLKEFTNAKYVFAYKLCYANKDQTYYYLVHATNNIQGITFMKDSFVSVNNGRVEYLGKRQDDITFFDLKDFKSYEFARNIFSIFATKRMTFASIWEQVAENVPYTTKDLSAALEMLEKEGKVTIQRISSKWGQYKEKDLIAFGDVI